MIIQITAIANLKHLYFFCIHIIDISYMKICFIYLLPLFLTNLTIGQVLNRQVVSNNGVSVTTKSGFFVSHTVGQTISSQTIKKTSFILQQGFQQSLYSILSQLNDKSNLTIVTKAYPNPFHSFIKVDFTEEITGEIEIAIIDVLGRVVYISSTKSINNSITIDGLDFLSEGNYFLSLKAHDYNYINQFIKN